MSKCIECSRLDLQSNRALAKLGFGRCPLDPTSTFVSVTFNRVCKKLQPAPADIVAARVTWAKKI
jgi:hypothetical protein